MPASPEQLAAWQARLAEVTAELGAQEQRRNTLEQLGSGLRELAAAVGRAGPGFGDATSAQVGSIRTVVESREIWKGAAAESVRAGFDASATRLSQAITTVFDWGRRQSDACSRAADEANARKAECDERITGLRAEANSLRQLIGGG